MADRDLEPGFVGQFFDSKMLGAGVVPRVKRSVNYRS
jgi:hypothetical protein